MDFIYSLFSEVNLNYVVLFFKKISHSQSYFVLFMYLWFAETDQYQGSLPRSYQPNS